jgi:hypothetical protein
VQALPLTWHGAAFGALHVFRADATGFADQQAECRALAVTLLIVSAHVEQDHLVVGLRTALAEEEDVSLGVAARRVLDRPQAGTLDARPTS